MLGCKEFGAQIFRRIVHMDAEVLKNGNKSNNGKEGNDLDKK